MEPGVRGRVLDRREDRTGQRQVIAAMESSSRDRALDRHRMIGVRHLTDAAIELSLVAGRPGGIVCGTDECQAAMEPGAGGRVPATSPTVTSYSATSCNRARPEARVPAYDFILYGDAQDALQWSPAERPGVGRCSRLARRRETPTGWSPAWGGCRCQASCLIARSKALQWGRA